jgi:PAS domain S-box-containing protein
MAIVILDLEFKVTNINPAFEKLFGYAQSEIIGVEIDDFLSTPEIVEEMRSLTEKGMQERIYFVGKRKKKDGALVDVEIFSEPFFVGEEKFGLLVFYNDISERLKAEAELDQTHATYRAVLDTLQDPYFEADPKGVITFVNQAFWRTLGYSSKDEVIGKNFRHVTDRKSVREVFNSFQTLYETQKNLKPFDYHYRRKDGSVLVAEIVVSPILDDGQVVGTRGIIRDISVRIRAEESQRSC